MKTIGEKIEELLKAYPTFWEFGRSVGIDTLTFTDPAERYQLTLSFHKSELLVSIADKQRRIYGTYCSEQERSKICDASMDLRQAGREERERKKETTTKELFALVLQD